MEKPGGRKARRGIGNPKSRIRNGFDQTPEGTARWRGWGAGARETAPRSPLLRRKMAAEKNSPAPGIRGGRGWEESGPISLLPLFLQLPFERLDFFGQRGIPGHQCL